VSDVVDLRPDALVGAKPFCGTSSRRSAKTSSNSAQQKPPL